MFSKNSHANSNDHRYKKDFAILPLKEYKKLLELIEDLQVLADVKKRAKEPRVPYGEVKKKFQNKSTK